MLGYQNISQVYAQYGHDGGDAILGSVGTMIFLPGLDDKTARYAAGRVGKTTVLQHTTVDGVGRKYDNERLAEVSRDLLDQSELRQMVRHRQAIAIIDTAPPIKFRFPSLNLKQEVKQPLYKGEPDVLELRKAESLRSVDRQGMSLRPGNDLSRRQARLFDRQLKEQLQPGDDITPPENI